MSKNENDNHYHEEGFKGGSITQKLIIDELVEWDEHRGMEQDVPESSDSYEKYSEEVEELFREHKLLPAELKWLKGVQNERAIFWAWRYLRALPYQCKSHFLSIDKEHHTGWGEKLTGDTILYEFFLLPLQPCSTAERSKAVICFFNLLQKQGNSSSSRRLLEDIRSIWINRVRPVRKIEWLKNKNESELYEIRDHLLKKYPDSSLQFFKPLDKNELRLAIICSIDLISHFHDGRDIYIKEEIFNELRINAMQNKRRRAIAEGNNKAGINAEISKTAKDALVKMARAKDLRINKFLELIIMEEYSKTK